MLSLGIASRGSFKRQIILTFVVGFFALATAFAVYLVKSERTSLYRDSANATTGLAQSLAVSSRSWVLANDVVGLQEVVQSFRDYPELHYAMVISPAGRVMAHSDAAKIGQFLTDEHSLALVKAIPSTRVMRDDEFVIDVAVPIEIGNRHVGWARIGLGREEVAGNLRKMIWNVTFFVILATVLSLLAAALVVNRLGRRIGSLVTVAQEVEAGNFATRVPDISGNKDEITKLAKGLNLMLDAQARNEERLRAASLYTRSLIEASLDPLVTISPEGKITDVNKATEAATGRSRSELIGTDFSDCFADPDKAREGYRQAFLKGYVTDYPLVLRHDDGSVTQMLYNASVYQNEKGEVLGVLASARDVTEHRRAELARSQLAAIVESSSDAIIGKTPDGIITSWNKGAEKIYGYSSAEVVGKHITTLAPAELHAEIDGLLETVRNGGTVENHETERVRKDGTTIKVALTLSPIRDASGKVGGISTIARDITERKRAEEQIRQSETKYRTLIQNIQAAVVVHGGDTRILISNSMAQEILGLSEDQLMGKSAIDPAWHFFGEDGKAAPPAEYPANRVLATRQPFGNLVLGVHRPGLENDVWVLVNADPVFDKSGEISQVIVTFIDITERKQAEESLKRMNERFLLASRAASLGVWDWNLQKNELVWDDGMYELYGVKREDFAGAYEAWLQGIHPDDRAASDEISKQAQRGEREYDTEFRVVWPDGSVHYLKAYGQFVRDAEGNPLRMTGINFDITGRKQAEEKLRRSEHGLSEAQRIAHLGNWELDLVKNVLTWSDEIFRIFEIEPDKFGASYEAFLNAIHPDDRDMVNKAYTDSVKNKVPYDIVHRLQMQDGRIKYVNEICETYYGANGKPLNSFGTVHDITDRILDQQALLRLNRELHAISNCNLVLMRAEDEQTLLDDICRIVCDEAGYRMAWVGYPENDETKTIRPVAWAGVEDGYLAQAGITWADTERGRGPSGTSIRSGKSACFQDISTDLLAAPWRESAMQRGYRSSISLPLKDENANTFGILTIYSTEPNAFTPEEIRLLEELAGDLAFGIIALRTRAERKQVEQALRVERGLFVAGPSVVFKWRAQEGWPVEYVSPNVMNQFGYAPEDLTSGKVQYASIVHPDDIARVGNEVSTYSKQGAASFEQMYRIAGADGCYRWIEDFTTVIRGLDGAVTHYLGYLQDITEHKQAEEEIKSLNHELEQRVAARTADLEAANKELESFSYSVSHDLRTPLRAIDGFSHILLEDYADKLDEEGKRLLNVVRNNTNRMGQLIDDILKFSRAGRLEINFSEINMEDLAYSVFVELRPVVAGDKFHLELESLPPARGDSAMMRQVFVNLLSNAIKFSGTREVPRIQVGATVKDDETIYFVKDNGVGFDMQFSGKLFGVFQRLHGVTEFEGTGIGLAIVKRIVTRHGGRVWAEGKVGEGAEFYFALPKRETNHE